MEFLEITFRDFKVIECSIKLSIQISNTDFSASHTDIQIIELQNTDSYVATLVDTVNLTDRFHCSMTCEHVALVILVAVSCSG